MAITNVPLVDALRTKMRWHQARQTLLAENVSNADTPQYRGKDLKAVTFASLVGAGGATSVAISPVQVATTTPGHLVGQEPSSRDGFSFKKTSGFEVSPNGNSVSLEAEMIKSSENQIDFQAASSLYQRGLNMFRTAIGKR